MTAHRLDRILTGARVCPNCHQALPEYAHGVQRFCNRNCQSAYWQRTKHNQGRPTPARAARQRDTNQDITNMQQATIQQQMPDPTHTTNATNGVQDAKTRPIDLTAHRLVVGGYLPEPFQIDPHDQRPLWDFTGLALLLDQRPHELVKLLLANGPAHLAADRGIPSSWAMLQNMTL